MKNATSASPGTTGVTISRTERMVRHTLVRVLGREDVIIGFLLAEGLLPLDGHMDMLCVLLREYRDEELVATLNRGHCEDRFEMRDCRFRLDLTRNMPFGEEVYGLTALADGRSRSGGRGYVLWYGLYSWKYPGRDRGSKATEGH